MIGIGDELRAEKHKAYNLKVENLKRARIKKILNEYNNEEKGGGFVSSLLYAYRDFLVDHYGESFLVQLREELKLVKKYLKFSEDFELEPISESKRIKKVKYFMENTSFFNILSAFAKADEIAKRREENFSCNAMAKIYHSSPTTFLKYIFNIELYSALQLEQIDVVDFIDFDFDFNIFILNSLSKIEELEKDTVLKLAQNKLEKENTKNLVIDKAVQNKLSQKD